MAAAAPGACRRRALAQAEALLSQQARARTLREMIAAAGMDLPAVADAIDIDREPLAEVEAGHVALPLPQRLVVALSRVFRVAATMVEAAMKHSHDHPRLGHAASERPPTVGRVTWRELIEDSDMSAERKAHWLAEG